MLKFSLTKGGVGSPANQQNNFRLQRSDSKNPDGNLSLLSKIPRNIAGGVSIISCFVLD